MNERTILIVRHPQTVANTNGRYVGKGDSPLTDFGREQADRIVEAIVAFGPDAVWASPLARTRIVAEAAAEALGLPVRFDDRLLELDFGEAEGLTFDEARQRGIALNYKAQDRPVARGGESRAELSRRTAAALGEILVTATRPVVVTHGGVLRAALVHLLRLEMEAMWRFDIRNGQLVTVHQSDGFAVLSEFRHV